MKKLLVGLFVLTSFSTFALEVGKAVKSTAVSIDGDSGKGEAWVKHILKNTHGRAAGPSGEEYRSRIELIKILSGDRDNDVKIVNSEIISVGIQECRESYNQHSDVYKTYCDVIFIIKD